MQIELSIDEIILLSSLLEDFHERNNRFNFLYSCDSSLLEDLNIKFSKILPE